MNIKKKDNGRAVSIILGIVSLVAVIIIVYLSLPKSIATTPDFKIGYTGSPLLSSLYLAQSKPEWKKNYKLVRFDSSADLGYALISGKLDAGFIEPSKALLIKQIREFNNIEVLGKVTYTYGAVLIVKKGLTLKIQELAGHTVAISETSCKLYHALKKDLELFGVDVSKVKFVVIPFDAMIPAIEAGKVDAAITKSAYGIFAKRLGLSIPYLQWDVTAGDACCPAVTAKTEFLLISSKKSLDQTKNLSDLLLSTQKESDSQLRQATALKTGIPLPILESLPLAQYSLADSALLKLFVSVAEDEAKEAQQKK